jgi:large subunit ribosomal protein L4e
MAQKKVKKVVKESHRTKAAKDFVPTKINVYGIDGSIQKQIDLPKAFTTEFRPDLISRASVSIVANSRQPYSPKPRAGLRHSVSTWGKGRGVSRSQRIVGSFRGAQSPEAVGGRRAHPPRIESDWTKKVNTKEMKLAKLSALAAVANPHRVQARGHKFSEGVTLPVVVSDEVEKIKSTRDAVTMLEKIGLYDDLVRAENGKRIRAGHGKMRNRKYRIRKSMLIVTSSTCPARKSFSNITGVDVATVDNLNVQQLAPGGLAGRLTILSEAALSKIGGWVA